jgi:hypothetical protein
MLPATSLDECLPSLQAPAEVARRLRQMHFPVSEILLAEPARRHLGRDNSNRLRALFPDADHEWASHFDLELPGEQADM